MEVPAYWKAQAIEFYREHPPDGRRLVIRFSSAQQR
jgi:hypothetical protein